jgi:hypothetical protein
MALIIGSADHRRRIHGHKQRALICRIPHVACGEPGEPLVSGAILAGWAEWADSTRFSTTPRLWEGYATAEVDAFRKELRDTFLGVRQPALIWDDVLRKWPGSGYHPWFSTSRGWSRPGYHVEEVDAFLNMAKLRLAAVTPDIEFTLYRDA